MNGQHYVWIEVWKLNKRPFGSIWTLWIQFSNWISFRWLASCSVQYSISLSFNCKTITGANNKTWKNLPSTGSTEYWLVILDAHPKTLYWATNLTMILPRSADRKTNPLTATWSDELAGEKRTLSGSLRRYLSSSLCLLFGSLTRLSLALSVWFNMWLA